jgi:hypothetical protein
MICIMMQGSMNIKALTVQYLAGSTNTEVCLVTDWLQQLFCWGMTKTTSLTSNAEGF